MRYLRPVRIDENDEEELRKRGFLDNRSPEKVRKAEETHRKLGDTEQAKRLANELEIKSRALQEPVAPAATARKRYTLAELQPPRRVKRRLKKESFIPLTLPNIMEINIVKGSDGKPVVASGKGTRLKNIGQPTEAALKRRRDGTQNAGSERLLRGVRASNRRTALIKRGRREEAKKVQSPPVSTDGIGGNRPGGDAESAEAIRSGIASRGHTR